ncbi:MAG TPA: beta-ketoacyl reductase, partial [Longimicrobiaceae bacterium]|nr:beta-ketoacyl reductase [Longimicrobiaceae bacterium]
PALSIAWGPWSGVGLAASTAERGERLADQGLRSLTPDQGIDALRALMGANAPPLLGVMRLDLRRWCTAHPAAATSPLLARLREDAPAASESERPATGIHGALLATASNDEREAMLQAHLRERAARVLRCAPTRVALHQPLRALGMDSLMTLELRNLLEADLEIPLSAAVIWNYPTIAVLARYLAAELGHSPTGAPATSGATQLPAAAAPGVIMEGLGREEVESLLDRELAAIDELLAGD